MAQALNRRLLKVSVQLINKAIPRVTVLAKNFQYKKILKKFSEVIKMSILHKQNAHGVEHVIETTMLLLCQLYASRRVAST